MTDLSLFDYQLPDELIAQRPAKERDKSRLFTLNRESGEKTHAHFTDFPNYLQAGDLLVLNETKVIPARLFGKRKSGGAVELLLIRSTGGGLWEVMTRGLSKLKPGEEIIVGDGTAVLSEKRNGGLALFKFESEKEVTRLSQQQGAVPLPPYIKRKNSMADASDQERYQTVFAKTPGSSAAPTAGLHFTKTILDEIKNRGVEIATITLHVGPGTFRPIKTSTIEEHVMDEEFYSIPKITADAVNLAKADGRRIVAVGSTVTRTLEAAADASGKVTACESSTSLFITPGYRFRIIDALLTNFHLPKSSLLVLVSSFVSRELVIDMYKEAVAKRYRFFSYGDAMFIE